MIGARIFDVQAQQAGYRLPEPGGPAAPREPPTSVKKGSRTEKQTAAKIAVLKP